MFFGALPIAETAGAMLAHGMRFPDKAFKKGHVLSQDDIAILADNDSVWNPFVKCHPVFAL